MHERRHGGDTSFRPLQLLGLLGLVVFVLFAGGQDSHARLDPYYVLRGLGSGDVRPRILFVVDTSGSMSWRATSWNEQCRWDDCEGQTDSRESRISVARRVINGVIEATADAGTFSLMTFDQYGPPTSIPALCEDGQRFTWVTYYGYFVWAQIWTHPAINGTWRLCQGGEQRPYPYLRWDELGTNSPITSNDQSGDIPDSPLIGSDPGAAGNAFRRVQWFPRFMGVRTQLNAETDADQSVLGATYGDYGVTESDRLSQVWGQDFYYWPYVDGFPHYAGYSLWPYNSGRNAGGVTGEDPSVAEAKLYAPFYIDLSSTDIAPENWGPSSIEEATATVLDHTAPLIEGGIDAAGGTPWASVIGEVGAYPRVNTAGGHTSVASYLGFITRETTEGVCAPTAAVLLTDGVPSPSSEGGSPLYRRLAALRTELGVKTYVVGFFQDSGQINEMACAAAGACDGGSCSSPCNDAPEASWDTCRTAGDPSECAFLANSADELSAVLTRIVTAELDLELPSGPGTTANEFGIGAAGIAGEGQIVQTSLSATTQWPGWRGRVKRSLCTHRDADGELLPQCTRPSPEWEPHEVQPTFGVCPQSYEWDAGECLALTAWEDRRIFTTNGEGVVIRVSESNGSASAEFREELRAQGLVSGANADDDADAIVAFLLGKDWPDGWKLPGLASSTPTLIRRVPPLRTELVPSVAIRDPHCAGRRLTDNDAGALPRSLEDFARTSTNGEFADEGGFEYQEAVLIGDDLGILHAFQYNSGNELWGFVPNELLDNVVRQAAYGAAAMGQPETLDEHLYGISASVNEGLVYDQSSTDPATHRWRHLAVFGFGPGGSNYVALDVSHMSPTSDRGPVEVLWSTADRTLAPTYDGLLGETWARPALTYHVPGNDMALEPKAFLVVGSGYGNTGTEGRVLLQIDAVTGEVLDRAEVESPAVDVYSDAFGMVTDPAVSSHCLSRFWAEAQETYVTDPSGRLFRWDLGSEASHEADSGGTWAGRATAVAQFTSCVGASESCSVRDGASGDPFIFAPAVTANDRIDDPTAPGAQAPEGEDQFLVALISGAHNDTSLDAEGDEDSFHSSLYILSDDHRADPAAGFSIPSGAPKMAVAEIGSHPAYLRLAVSDLPRTRLFTPYPGADPITETRTFSSQTRPVRAPRILMKGVVDRTTTEPQIVDGVEIAEVTFRVYEPPTESCDPRFYDPETGTWYTDEGATFEIVFQLTADSTGGFDFSAGASEDSVSFADEGQPRGLALVGVEQVQIGDCADGNCGPEPSTAAAAACDNQTNVPPVTGPHYAIPIAARQLQAFTPVE